LRKSNKIYVCHVTEFFSLSNLSRNVDNGNGGSLVVAVHNLDLQKKELSNKNSAKIIINTQKIEFWQAPNA
jgi:hypothetical protein